MNCPIGNHPTSRIIIDTDSDGNRRKVCAEHRGMSEAKGANVSNILTRSSDRVREQQLRHEGDIILPHQYDKLTNKYIPNPDFVRLYPDKLPTYFTAEELKQHGYDKPEALFEAKAKQEAEIAAEKAQVEFAADDDGAKQAEVVKALDD